MALSGSRRSWCQWRTLRRALSSKSSLPGYNYGLSGKAKYKRHISPSHVSLPAVHGEFLYGIHPVTLSLKAQKRSTFHSLYCNDKFDMKGHEGEQVRGILEQATQLDVPVQYVSRKILDQLSGNRPHQGVGLDTAKLEVSIWDDGDSLERVSDLPLWMLLHNIQDPMNFGAILRTAHFLGVDRVVVPHSNSCKLSPVVSKASAGAMEVVNLARLSHATSETFLCQWWKSHGGEVVGTSAACDGDERLVSLEKFAVTKPTMLLLGNEGSGLSQALENCCDRMLTIAGQECTEISGLVNSLNVSVATGIILHWMKYSSRDQR